MVVSIAKPPNTHFSKSLNIVDEDFECVKVEISDLDSAAANPTMMSLIRCKQQVLLPFRKLLCFIGWRPFGTDRWGHSPLYLRIINIIYPIFILMLLLFNYTYEIIVCQGKLNVITDTKSTTTTTTTTTFSTTTTTTTYRITSRGSAASIMPGSRTTTFKSNLTEIYNHPECGHIFTTYILPDIFHFAAFIIGFIHFRMNEGEPMYALMEKVFIHADQSMRLFSPNRVIRRLRLFMGISAIWVLLSISAHALSNASNDFAHSFIFGEKQPHDVMSKNEKPLHFALFTIDIICLLISNCILVAVVMHFAWHCEMIIFYGKAIRTRLEEKSIHLLEAMKRIVDLGLSISQLNSSASRIMSILLIFFLQRSILGIILLVVNRIFEAKMWIYRSLFVVTWLSILIFCLSEAARVTSKCDKFHRIGLSMRVYGYHNANQAELDGFLSFISKASLRAKLFGLTVRPGKLIFISVCVLLTFVMLFQTSIAANETFFF